MHKLLVLGRFLALVLRCRYLYLNCRRKRRRMVEFCLSLLMLKKVTECNSNFISCILLACFLTSLFREKDSLICVD